MSLVWAASQAPGFKSRPFKVNSVTFCILRTRVQPWVFGLFQFSPFYWIRSAGALHCTPMHRAEPCCNETEGGHELFHRITNFVVAKYEGRGLICLFIIYMVQI